jgi:hypothetical protein
MDDKGDPFDFGQSVTVQTLDSFPDKMPQVVIKGLLRKLEMMLIGGHAKSWKSWALLDLLYCVANGLPWFMFPTLKGTVLHIDLELLEADLKYRFRAIQQSYGEGDFANLYFISLRGKPFDLNDLMRLPDQIDLPSIALFSLDPTYRLLGNRNESDPGIIIDLLNRFLALATTLKAASAILQHFSKGNQADKNAIERFSGSGVWGRFPDSLSTFTQLEDEECFQVSFTLRAFPPVDCFAVRWEYPRFRIAPDLDPEKLRSSKAGRPKLNTSEQLAGLIHAEESISYADLCRRAEKLCQMKKRSFDRRLVEAKNQKLIYLSPINNEYALTSEYLKRNGSTA